MASDTELLEMIAAQRRDLADLLDGLTDAQAATASLCAGWTVKDVAVHVTIPLHTSLPRFALAIAGSFGNFDKAMIKIVRKESSRSLAAVAKELRDQATNPFTPPGGFGFIAPLDDALVHTQDIRRPLGLGNGLAPDRVKAVLDGLANKKFDKILKRERFAGVRLEADDLDYSSGSGPTATGPGEAVLMTLNGRVSALDDLTGDGVAILRRRLAS